MTIKILGAILVIVGCGSLGFLMTSIHKREVAATKQLIVALDYMECELQYRLTPLPQLCRQTAGICKGVLSKVFMKLADELEDQISPDAALCMESTLMKVGDIPCRSRYGLELLGRSLGMFDLDGQIKGLKTVRDECNRFLESYTNNEDIRLRNYQTLALCAGAALVIILI